MTEKRFTYNVNKNTIECDGKFVAYVNCVDGFRIANKLSVLSDENEQLKNMVEHNYVEHKRCVNNYVDKIKEVKKENERLKKQINGITLNWTQNHQHFDKDTLHIKDNNTEINLKDRNLCIEVVVPEINEYFRFRYIVTGRIFERTLEYSEEG